MDSEIVAHVIAEEAQLRAELEPKNEKLMRLQAFLSVYEETAERLSKGKVIDLQATTAPSNDGIGSGLDVLKFDASQPPPRMKQTEFVRFVRTMILDHGRPMVLKELLDGFHRNGRRVSAGNELKGLSKKLSAARAHIKRIPWSGYWPIDVPCARVGYTPPRPVVAA